MNTNDNKLGAWLLIQESTNKRVGAVTTSARQGGTVVLHNEDPFNPNAPILMMPKAICDSLCAFLNTVCIENYKVEFVDAVTLEGWGYKPTEFDPDKVISPVITGSVH